MYLTKTMTAAGTGSVVTHHGISQVVLAADLASLVVHIEQWPSELARMDRASPTGFWRVAVQAAALDLQHGLAAGIRAAVVADPVFEGGTWAPGADGTVATAKVRQWAAIKAERDRRQLGTFTVGRLVFNQDPAAINGAWLDAMQGGKGWPVDWVLADDTVATLTAAEMIEVGRASWAHRAQLWATSQALREQLLAVDNESGTLAQVAAVQWPILP